MRRPRRRPSQRSTLGSTSQHAPPPQPAEHPQQVRLAGAVGPDQHVERADLDAHGRASERQCVLDLDATYLRPALLSRLGARAGFVRHGDSSARARRGQVPCVVSAQPAACCRVYPQLLRAQAVECAPQSVQGRAHVLGPLLPKRVDGRAQLAEALQEQCRLLLPILCARLVETDEVPAADRFGPRGCRLGPHLGGGAPAHHHVRGFLPQLRQRFCLAVCVQPPRRPPLDVHTAPSFSSALYASRASLWILTKSGRPASIRVSRPADGIRVRG